MRLNAVGAKLALKKKPVTKTSGTCGDQLAAAFNAAKHYASPKGEFKAQGFKLGRRGLSYESDDSYTGYLCEWFFSFDGFADNCGILIIGAFIEVPQDPAILAAVLRTCACAGRNGNFGMMLASVNHKQSVIIEALKAFGMTELYKTHNPNSGNKIAVYGKDINGVKDTLGIGNSCWDNSARGWLHEDD